MFLNDQMLFNRRIKRTIGFWQRIVIENWLQRKKCSKQQSNRKKYNFLKPILQNLEKEISDWRTRCDERDQNRVFLHDQDEVQVPG